MKEFHPTRAVSRQAAAHAGERGGVPCRHLPHALCVGLLVCSALTAQPPQNRPGGGQAPAASRPAMPQQQGRSPYQQAPNPRGYDGRMPAQQGPVRNPYQQTPQQVYPQPRNTYQQGSSQQQGHYPQGVPAQGNLSQRFLRQQPGTANGNNLRGEHLQQWMERHNQLNTQQQQHALQNEPGFRQLPQETQQRMLNRLDHLNNMTPDQRQRVLQRSEAMERLSPDQRGQVRSAMGQWGGLPQDRRRAVGKAFRDLRGLPPQQRNQILNSPEYRQQFNDEERGTLGNLLSVSPMLPLQ